MLLTAISLIHNPPLHSHYLKHTKQLVGETTTSSHNHKQSTLTSGLAHTETVVLNTSLLNPAPGSEREGALNTNTGCPQKVGLKSGLYAPDQRNVHELTRVNSLHLSDYLLSSV